MAGVAEREGVAVICRDSSRLRDGVHGAPVLGFVGSSEPTPLLPRSVEKPPQRFNGLGGPRAGAVLQLETAQLARQFYSTRSKVSVETTCWPVVGPTRGAVLIVNLSPLNSTNLT